MRHQHSVRTLDNLGRVQLSKTFYMRDFLYSEISQIQGIPNIPEDPDLAIAVGRRLCEDLLEPLQNHFGRIAVRSAYRSPEVNDYGNKKGLNCASNAANAAHHIWDKRDKNGHMGATACIVIPWFADRFTAPGEWRRLAWWIHDHLPYGSMEFFKQRFALNLQWHEAPSRRISSHAEPSGVLTKPGMSNHTMSHAADYAGLPAFDPQLCAQENVRPFTPPAMAG